MGGGGVAAEAAKAETRRQGTARLATSSGDADDATCARRAGSGADICDGRRACEVATGEPLEAPPQAAMAWT